MKKTLLLFAVLAFGLKASAQIDGRIHVIDDVYMDVPHTLSELQNAACGCNLQATCMNGCTTSTPIYSVDGLGETMIYRGNVLNRVGGVMWSGLYMHGAAACLGLKDAGSPFYSEFFAGALTGNRTITTPDNDGMLIVAYTGSGSPEGVVVAVPGKIYIDTTTTPGKKLWVKEANTTAWGWEAK